ncbi:hypothetical protein V1477_004812, partial [Vespula maculifrons]
MTMRKEAMAAAPPLPPAIAAAVAAVAVAMEKRMHSEYHILSQSPISFRRRIHFMRFAIHQKGKIRTMRI